VSARPAAIVLVDDAVSFAVQTLCGRPAVDWLLDTVVALAPVALTVRGADPAPVHERIALRPALDKCVNAAIPPDAVTIVLPCSLPLLLPATVRRAVQLLLGDDPSVPSAVKLAPTRRSPWWAEPDGAAAASPLAGAVAGVTGSAVEGILAGAATRAVRLGAVESLWLADPADRAAAANALYARIAASWQDCGVVIDDPATTRIDATVHIGPGARIRPQTELLGDTVIGAGSRVGPVTTVRDCVVGASCEIQYAVCQDAEIGEGARVGPFAWLRSGTRLGAHCRAGAFVEVADSNVGDGTSIPHLAGLFSADVGRNGNFGSMSGPANFDGRHKHRSRFGDDVSIGAGTVLVAPVSVGDGASTAAGSVITEDVPEGALALARAPQRNVTGWARRHRG
jgi:UDP-3-O-[3-hydroxymyristoyl] glucosamine N-acyltransferase